MNYEQAKNYLAETAYPGIAYGLGNMRALCEQADHVQKMLPVIHIAGTNGKGSVGAFLEAILTAAGFLVGRYASPAVFDRLEIYRCNGTCMTKTEYAYYMEKCREIIERIPERPSQFEIETLIAFLFFRDKQCDFVLLEAGMGGKDDATNIIENKVMAVFTAISEDHSAFLGDTPAEIARNKAGILRRGVPAVTAPQEQTVLDVLQSCCERLDTVLHPVRREDIKIHPDGGFDYREFLQIKKSLAGIFQYENCALALEVCHVLNNMGYFISDTAAREGCQKAVWHGRLEQILSEPVFLIDGAHNMDAAKRLMESLEEYHGVPMVFLIGMLKDKQYGAVVRETVPAAERVYTVTPPSERALDALSLCREVKKYNHAAFACDSIHEGVMKALSHGQMVVAFGTLSFLKEIVKEVKQYEAG